MIKTIEDTEKDLGKEKDSGICFLEELAGKMNLLNKTV